MNLELLSFNHIGHYFLDDKGKMDRLDASEIVDDMQYPGSDLHPLSGKLKDHWAVAGTGNYRLTFKFENGDAFIVDYQDYH
jgi:toxin HigB-1